MFFCCVCEQRVKKGVLSMERREGRQPELSGFIPGFSAESRALLTPFFKRG